MAKTKSPKKDLKERLLAFHSQKLKDSAHVLMGEKVISCFDYLINTYGSELLVTDLQAKDKFPESQVIYPIEAGALLNLNTIWEVGVINRNRRALLPVFEKMKSLLDPDYPALLLVSKEDFEAIQDDKLKLPFNLEQKSLVARLKEKGKDHFEFGMNEYDEKLIEDLEKEEKSWEKASKHSGIGNKNRKTKEEAEKSI